MYMIRGTELQDFLRCRLAWKYRWIDGLQSKKPNVKLAFGSAMHKFLEEFYGRYGMIHYYDAKDLARFMLNEEIRDELDWQDQEELLSQVIDGYVKEYAEHDLNNWEVIATELTFAISLDDEIGYTGTIDLIVRDKSDGKIYLADHKTTISIEKYDKNSDMDRQISRYWWALQQLQQGKGQVYEKVWNEEKSEIYYDWMPISISSFDLSGEIGGFLYNIILKDYPVPPKVLKNGSLSKDKSQKTTYEMYLDELNHRELIPKDTGWVYSDYADILQHFLDNPREYFRRLRVTRTQSEIDASIEELYATARDMSVTKWSVAHPGVADYNAVYRNITKDCPWCPFQPICQASMDGSNVEFLTETSYTVEPTER